ncbi:VanZ family protein [Siminovitchia sp. 179-K 8D1 HS]|uniref:VanZ family protein n=1 Tax=Siminovitchia sp. 179-K 8D1 HS TaxID=3142385 RepID=UPI0039A21165
MMEKRHLWLLAAIGWCAAIFIATGSPSSTGGSTRFLFERFLHLSPEQASVFNLLFRKMVHLTAFGLLAVLFYHGLRKRKFFMSWFLATVYAASDELHQLYVPDRTASIWDVGIDSLGAILALWLAASLSKRPDKNA